MCFSKLYFERRQHWDKYFGKVIPFPNNLSTPRLPRGETTTVASAGTAFEIAEVAYGRSLVPRDASIVNRFPPCFTILDICVFDILISEPIPFAIDSFILSVFL